MRSDNLVYEIAAPNNTAFIDAAECYYSAEQKAADYYKSLYQQVINKTYISTLTKDFKVWKHKHVHHHFALLGFFSRNNKPDSHDYHRYIQWLDYTGKLEAYLERSISYIFMRDLLEEMIAE